MYRYEKSNSAPVVSFKSAFIIVGSILVGSFFFPAILNQLGLDLKWLRVIVLTALTAFSTCFCFFFIETDKGFSKTFWLTFIVLSFIIGLISVFWIYEILYI